MDKYRQRAEEFERDVDECLLDERGLLMSALDINTMKPFERGRFYGASVHAYPGHNWDDFADFIAYENVGMVSGAFLAAMVWKYRATKDPVALDKAYRTFNGIKWLFDLSQEIDDGFYCKCYGGKLSDQMSSDQYVYTFVGLDQFMAFADFEKRRQCADMIEKMVRFWMRRRYSYPYFGKSLDWPLERFPVFVWLAWRHTGKKEFLDEFNRLRNLPVVRKKIPFGDLTWEERLRTVETRDPAFPFEKNSTIRVLRMNPENTESGFLSLEALLEYDAPERELWLDKTRKMFDRDRRWIADDGYAMDSALYDVETGEIREVREIKHVPDFDDPEKWRFPGLIGWIRSAMHSAMFARAAVAIHAYFPEAGALRTAADILDKLKRENLHWFHDVDGKQYPDDLKWMDDVYSGDAVTHWLWAYWEARAKYGSEWMNLLSHANNPNKLI